MVEITIPKEVTKYETKLIGNFTARQTVCIIFMVLLCVGGYNLMINFLPQDTVLAVCMVLASPFAACGWIKPYGMHFEDYAKIMLFSNILAPKNRKYKVENTFDLIVAEDKKAEPKQKPKKYKKSKEAFK